MSKTKILLSERPPAQRKRRSSVKPMWWASLRDPIETELITLP